MKRLVFASAAVLLSTLTLCAQNGSSIPVIAMPASAGSQKHPHNKQHNKQNPTMLNITPASALVANARNRQPYSPGARAALVDTPNFFSRSLAWSASFERG
jgi:hypothetical protein